MRAIVRHGLSLVLLLLSLAAGASAAEMRHRAGDDPRWAAPDWDDGDWEPGNEVPTRAGIHWVRIRFHLRESASAILPEAPFCMPTGLDSDRQVDSLYMATPYSYELYWDGRLIGGKGRVGETREEEITGPLDSVIMVPAELRAAGTHVIAMRVSTQHYNFPATKVAIGFFLSNAAGHYAGEALQPVFPLIGAGGALVVALLSAVLFWLVDRWRPLLLCSFVSLALAVFYLLVAWRWIHNAPYEWFYPRLLAAALTMTVVAWLFPWLLLEQFAVPRRAWWLAGLAPLLVLAWVASPFYEIKALWQCRAMLAVSVGIAGWAVAQRRPGARFVLVGVIAGLVLVNGERREFLDPTFYFTFGGLVLFVFATLGLQLRTDRRRAQQATLTTARLETELLKKNIQPHFLMNTLTTIMEVIEQEPKSAVTLIDALAGEFRILARVSGEKLIPLGQELELCRAHLHIMSLRRGIKCSLDVTDADETSPVPPALFHTLVEGGLTHQLPREGRLRFTLEAAYQPGVARYTLTVHGGNPPPNGPVREGTGLRYVKARLEESFAGRWTLQAGPVPEGWQTIIEIRHPPGESGAA